MFAANSGTEVGVVSDGEFDGNNNAPVVVKTVQVGAKWAAGVIIVVVGSTHTFVRAVTFDDE